MFGPCRWCIVTFFFFSSRRRHTRSLCDWSSDVCSSDLDGAPLVVEAIHDLFPWLRHLFADRAYSGDKLAKALTQFGRWTIEIVKRDAPGFVVLPRRWVVERTLAWLNRNRRLATDFEASIASAKAWL